MRIARLLLLPASVRARFDNDPSKFVEFATDEANLAELRSLGLLSPEAVERLDAAEAAALAKAAERPPEPSKPVEKASEKPRADHTVVCLDHNCVE